MSLRNNILYHTDKILKALLHISIYGIFCVGLITCKEKNAHKNHDKEVTQKDNVDSLLANIHESTNNTVLSSQQVIKVGNTSANRQIKASGIISFDERRNNSVSARISGRIEKLFVRYNFQYIKKGQPVLSLYSPDMQTFMEQYLLLKNAGNAAEMLELSYRKLRLLGMSVSQIEQMEKQGKPLKKITFYSPYSGYIKFGSSNTNPIANKQKMSGSGMNGMSGNKTSQSDEITSSSAELKPGAYVQEGETLFSVNDLAQVWALLSIPSDQLLYLKTGTPVKLHVEAVYDTIEATIDFIEPALEPGEKFGRVRAYIPNPKNALKPNAIVNATILTSGSNGIFVPFTAVYSLGRQKIVWLKTGISNGRQIFKVRKVTTGTETTGLVEITSGLKPGDEIAKNAAYLVDREGLIK